MGKTLNKLKDLAGRAGKWLGRAGTPPQERATAAVVADRFDAMAWRETYDQAAALRELAQELNERYDHTEDLLRDLWLAAYKASPQVREKTAMDVSRLVNHQVVTAMVASPEFEDLHRETVGDPYGAAMALLAQADVLRRLLDQTRNAQAAGQQAHQAQEDAQEAARAVAEALERAAGQEGEDGTVPAEAAAAVQQALDRAETADQAAQQAAQTATRELAAATPGIRAAVRRATAEAAEQAREEVALMRAWGVEPGQLERMGFEQRTALAERLRSGRLGRFADLIGRFRQMAFGERARKVENAPGELVGITLGDDLSRVIPSELAQLGVPVMRAKFAAKFAEAQLMLYDSRGEQSTGQGAIIAAIDCSFSMTISQTGAAGEETTREAWAKACALALLDQARGAKRDFIGILFASEGEVSVHRFPADRPVPINDVIDFAEHFFGGGTNFETPLTVAVDILEAEFNAEGRPKGDIVLVTDGVCEVSEDWMHRWNDAKHRLGFRTFGLAIGDDGLTGPGSVLDALCDNLRSLSDLSDPRTVSDLFRVI